MDFMPQITVTLTFDLLPPKSIGIIYGSFPSMITRKANLSKISLKLISGQNFANAVLTDGRTNEWTKRQTDGRTDDIRHNIIRPKVPSVDLFSDDKQLLIICMFLI